MTVKRFLSRLLAGCLALGACLAISACATASGSPSATQVAEIQNACAVDAGLRPTVNVLISLPGLATPAEVEAVNAAHAIIDPVCANPSGSLQTNTLTVFSESTAQILNVVAMLQSRKAKSSAAPVAPAMPSAAPASSAT